MPCQTLHIPAGAAALLRRIVMDDPSNTLTINQLIVQLIQDGLDVLAAEHGIGPEAVPGAEPWVCVPKPFAVHRSHPDPLMRPEKTMPYLKKALQTSIVDWSANLNINSLGDFKNLWRALVVGGLAYRLGGRDNYYAAIRKATDPDVNDGTPIVLGPRPLPPLGNTPRPPMFFRRSVKEQQVDEVIMPIPLPINLENMLRNAVVKLGKRNLSCLVRDLLVAAMPHVSELTSKEQLIKWPSKTLSKSRISVLMPRHLADRYDALAALIGGNARSKLMRHALVTQLAREFNLKADKAA